MRALSSARLLIFVISMAAIAAASTPQVSPRLPVLFERNSGENAPVFPLLARGHGYALLLGRGQLQLRKPGVGAATIRFAGASGNVVPDPLVPSATFVNDYTGGRQHWNSGAATWQQAEYRGLYPGIDLVFYGNNGEIEYDARIQPGGKPSDIAFLCDGPTQPRIGASGDLALSLGPGSVTWHKPVAYQTVAGRRVPVDAWFTVKGHRIGFGVGAFDRRYPLVIDPTLSFSTFLGGSGSDYLRAIAVDPTGNVYVIGATSSGDLPVTAASAQSAYKGGAYYGPADVFVAKLNPAATALIYITYLGGTGIDTGLGVVADASGSAYVTGATDSTDFPVTKGAYQTNFGGDQGVFTSQSGDAFATKFDATGKLVWSTFLGGASNEIGSAIALDTAGNVIVVGATQSSNFPTTGGAFQTAFGGGDQPLTISPAGYVTINLGDGFVSKLDPTGSKLLASTFLGGSGDDMASTVTVDTQGNIWTGGATASSNFTTTASAIQRNFGGASNSNLQAIIQFGDAFVTEFTSDLTKVVYSTYLGGSNDDAITGIVVDASNNVFVCGFTQSSNFPVKGAYAGTYQGPSSPPDQNPYMLGDAFVAKLTAAGGLIFSEYLGGQLDDAAGGIALDTQGNPIVVGVTNSTGFPTTGSPLQSKYGGVGPYPYNDYGDGFLTQVNGTTGALLYSTFIGGVNSDAVVGVAASSNGSVFLAGSSFSSNFPVTAGILQPALNTRSAGSADAVIMKFTFTAAQTLPTIAGVANAASYASSSYSPGEIVTVFGQNMGPAVAVTAQLDSTGKLATVLSNAEVLFDNQPAPLVYVSATQSAAIIPYEVATKGSTQMTVSYNGAVSSATTLKIGPASPGLFAANQQGNGQGAILNQDQSFNSAQNPAAAGSIIALYGTGEGQLNPAGVTGQIAPGAPPFPVFAGSLTVTIGGITAPMSTIFYNGPVPGFVDGEFQLNVQIPTNVPSGNQPVVVTIAGVPSQNNLTVAVK